MLSTPNISTMKVAATTMPNINPSVATVLRKNIVMA